MTPKKRSTMKSAMTEKATFDERVYAAVCAIPRGCVSTYGRIAEACGSPRAARAVGMALHRNPRPGEIPCHRVVNREGYLAPAFAFGGSDAQMVLLQSEGIEVVRDSETGRYRVSLERYLCRSINIE